MSKGIDLILKNINTNRQHLTNMLNRLVNANMCDFEEKTAKFIFDIEKVKNDHDFASRLQNLSIGYTDYFRKLTRKIDNLIVDKNAIFKRNDELFAHHFNSLTDQEKHNFKNSFATICSYDTKGAKEMET